MFSLQKQSRRQCPAHVRKRTLSINRRNPVARSPFFFVFEVMHIKVVHTHKPSVTIDLRAKYYISRTRATRLSFRIARTFATKQTLAQTQGRNSFVSS